MIAKFFCRLFGHKPIRLYKGVIPVAFGHCLRCGETYSLMR